MSDTTTTTGTTDGKRQFDAAMLSKCRALLAEESAVLVSLERGTWRKKVPPPENSPTDTQPTYTDAAWVRIVRRWPRISDADRAMCEEFLARFASVKNATVTPPATEPAECGTVERPKADRETFSGTWRMRKTALPALKTDPMQQGVFQTLVWPADFDGEFGDFCAESSPLHHEDAKAFANAPVPPTAAHANVPGHIYRVNASVNPEDGTWQGQEVDDIARNPGLCGTWSRTEERVTLRIRGEHLGAGEEPRETLFPAPASVAGILALAAPFKPSAPDAPAGTDWSRPVMSSTVDFDPYALFSVTAEISWPVASLVAVLRKGKRSWEVSASYSNLAAAPTWAQALAALPADDRAAVDSLPLKGYALPDGGAPRKNEFGLLDGAVSWRIPAADDATAAEGGGLAATWSRTNDRWTLRLRGDYRRAPLFPTNGSASEAAIVAIAARFATTGALPQLAHPAMSSTADMDAFGLFTVSAEIHFPVATLTAHSHVHRRYAEVEAAFANRDAVPALADCTAIAPVPAAAMGDYAIVAGVSARLNEFGLLDGTVAWRVPLSETFGWFKAGNDPERPVWRYWAWNQIGDWTPPSISPSPSPTPEPAATGTLVVMADPPACGAFFSVDGVHFPCGTAVTLPAGQHAVAFVPPEGWTATAQPSGAVNVASGASVSIVASFTPASGSAANPVEISPVYVDEANGGWLEAGDLVHTSSDDVYRVTGKFIDVDGNESIVQDKWYDGDVFEEITVLQVGYIDLENFEGYSLDPEWVEGDTLLPFEAGKWYQAPDTEPHYFDGEDLTEHPVVPNVAYLDAENALYGYDYDESAFAAGTHYAFGGRTYLWTGYALADVTPGEPTGTSADPIPVTAAAIGGTRVTREGSTTPEAAVAGAYYMLVSGAYAGLLRTFDGTAIAACTATLDNTGDAATAAGGAVSGGGGGGSSIFQTENGVKVVKSSVIPAVPGASAFQLETHVQLEFNEFGLVDATASCEGEANPYGPNGITYGSGKSLERWIFVNNASGLHGTEGYYQGVRDEKKTTLRAFKTLKAARDAADGVLDNLAANKAAENNISRHGKWWVLATHVTTRHAGS